MQQLKTSRIIVALGALGLALLPLSGAVQAKDKYKGNDHWNRGESRDRDDYLDRDDYRNRDNDWNRGRDRDRDNNDDVRYGNYGRVVTLEAVVTDVNGSSTSGTRKFRVRAGGKSFDVVSDSNVRVREGQRVTLRGSFDDKDDFKARSVDIEQRGNNGGYIGGNNGDGRWKDGWKDGEKVNFPAVISRVFNSGELEVRAENGRNYRVLPRGGSGQFQTGNRIRVEGTARNNRVENARITFQNGGVVGPDWSNKTGIFRNGGIFGNGGGIGNAGAIGNSGQKVNFYGRVTSVDAGRRTAIVRGDNGRSYNVRGDELKTYKGNERVRVYGAWRNGVIELSDIDRITN